jgi:TolA-binding protein
MSEQSSRSAQPVEDLSVLARRGALSDAEQRALANALEASATLAVAHQVGLDFDHAAAVRPGDDALIAGVAGRTSSRSSSVPFGRQSRRPLLLLVAALVATGSAAAWWQHSRVHAIARVSSGPSAPKGDVRSEGSTPTKLDSSALPESASPTEMAARTAASAGPTLPRGARSADSSERTFDNAEVLFREANAARRSGDLAVARALYLRLEHDFPASDEAILSHVSLGNLLLAMGRAAEAERQFASYLGGHPALAQEALVGRAESLAALGRTVDERAVWHALLHDHPSSVYASRAKLRLAELAHGSPASD